MIGIQKSKIKNQKFNLKLKTFYFLLAILTFNFCLLTLPIYAAESTPSADIRAKLEELKKEIASKAAKFKQEINRQLKDKAYIGNVKTKSGTSLTLATSTGPKIVSLNQDSEFETKVKTKLKFSQKTLAEEDYLAALGDVDETGVLTAKKVILLPNSEPKAYLWGQIVAISDKLITLHDRRLKNMAASLTNPSSVKVSDFVILTGYWGKNDIFKAEFVFVYPQGGILKPKKVATPSSQIATPSSQNN